MRRVTRNIGISNSNQHINLSNKIEISRILISRPNHRLGNLLLITPLLQEVIETFPHAKIDLFVKGHLAPILFKHYTNIDRIIELPRKPFKHLVKYVQGWFKIKLTRYDIVVNVVNHSASGRLSAQFANSKYKFFGDTNLNIQLKYKDHEHMAKYPVYSFRTNLNKLGYATGEAKVSSLNLKLSPLEVAEGKRILSSLVINNKKTICLFTYATGSKCYASFWWDEFYNRLRSEYHECNIIEVLPVENISQISFNAPTFYSKDIREVGSFIANVDVFIGADSGIMHLASSVQTPTVGLFKITNSKTYEPYNKNSIAVDTNKISVDDCIQLVTQILTNTL